MMKRSVEINTFIDLFSYDPISTKLNLMKYKKSPKFKYQIIFK